MVRRRGRGGGLFNNSLDNRRRSGFDPGLCQQRIANFGQVFDQQKGFALGFLFPVPQAGDRDPQQALSGSCRRLVNHMQPHRAGLENLPDVIRQSLQRQDFLKPVPEHLFAAELEVAAEGAIG